MPKILIIEDEKNLRDVLRMALEGAYAVRCAADGKAGVREAVLWQPDVVITDFTLPGMTGIDVIQAIRSGRGRENREMKNGKLPGIILVSAAMSLELEKAAMEAGANRCLAKPFDLQKLKKKIKEYTDDRGCG